MDKSATPERDPLAQPAVNSADKITPTAPPPSAPAPAVPPVPGAEETPPEVPLTPMGWLAQNAIYLVLIAALVMLLATPSAVLSNQQPAPQQQPQTKQQTVYITRTGKKYHQGTCRYLSRSKIATSLKDAKANGFTACSVCRPPQ